ncbi:hypothetical protein [Candidatus Poriferisodalis sp.]|uniref:hypothetical protein n=1 Tax=Candidatus Poriferisodalis sp. TaxID=3101277 RepID=UPI003B019F26
MAARLSEFERARIEAMRSAGAAALDIAVVLVRGNPDGVAAAPVLASSLTGGALVTPLIVGETLPAAVRDYLAATPKAIGGINLNLGIVAVGGTAAVSQAVMDAATAAAASSGALTVQIGAGDNPATSAAREGDTNRDGVANADDPVRPQSASGTFALYFSDDVTSGSDAADGDGLTVTNRLRDIVEVNGIPAVVTSAVTGVTGGGCADNVVYVALGQGLSAGDVISIASSTLKLGTDEDQRTVVPASTTVQAAPKDTGRPQVSIIGIASPRSGSSPGADAFTLTVTDPGGLAPDTLTAAGFACTRGAGSTSTSSSSTVDPVSAFGTAAIPAETGGEPTTSFTTTVSLTNPLVAGDRLVLKSSRVKDRAGNLSSAKPGTAIEAEASPRISSVLMSGLKHSALNSWTLPATAADATTASDAANAVTITAKAAGDAAGAAGNAWRVVFDTASTYMASKPLDIDVRVDTKGKRATVRFVNGAATVHDLVAALRANEDFDSRFAVALPCSGTTRTPLAVTNANRNVSAAPTNAGRTQFAIEVNFNRYISAVDADAHDALLRDLLAAAAARAKVDNTDAVIGADASGEAGTPAAGGLSMASTGQTAVTGPTKKVRYEGETAVAGLLPMARDLVDTAAGHEGQTADTTANPPVPAIIETQAVALGYAADAAPTSGTHDPVEEDKNANSENRIAVSSNVKAHN